MMKLHNTLTRSVDTFKPIADDLVTLYSCGPTVYATPHIGNWTAYVRWDILARTLRQHYVLNWYMNLTDVGHLVSDADDGEDKLEKGARLEGKTAWEVAEFYTQEFKDGLKALNVSIDFNHLVKATDHVGEQVALIQKLEENGYTYVIDDGVYYDSTKFADYGKMARLDLAGLQAGARVELGDKKNASDFALWKFAPKGQTRDMEWDSPWGRGFPGWHIECSAMAMRYLGETIDIHTGGIDHIPVHHTNEIAQSEAATGQQFVNYWLHNNFLQVDSVKISKSLNNGFTFADLADKGFSPQDFRMLLLQSHYQTEANFTWETLVAAQNRLKELQAFADLRYQVSDLNSDQTAVFETAAQTIQSALEDNLNTPQVLAELSSLISAVDNVITKNDEAAFASLLETLDDLLGFDLITSIDIDEDQKQMIAERALARSMKDWHLSDILRDQLTSEGLELKDTTNGTIWSRL